MYQDSRSIILSFILIEERRISFHTAHSVQESKIKKANAPFHLIFLV